MSAAAAPSYVPTPFFALNYQGANITADVSAMVTEIEYTDELGGAAGSAQVSFEDRDGRWRNAWRPGRGDTFSLVLGYGGGADLDCGIFQVDEVQYEGIPDVVHMKGIETAITPDLRTARSLGYENATLGTIAGTITLYADADPGSSTAAANAAAVAFALANASRIGRDIVISQLVAALQAVPGVYEVVLTSLVDGTGALVLSGSPGQWGNCTAINLTQAIGTEKS